MLKVNQSLYSPLKTTSVPAFQAQEQIQNKPEEKHKLNDYLKYAIGATILASTIAVGIFTHQKIKTNKLNREIKNITQQILKKNNSFSDVQIWDEKIMQQHISDALGLKTKQKQLERLKNINDTISNDRGFYVSLYKDAKGYYNFKERLPEEIQKVIDKGDRYTATKMYFEYCDNLFYPSQTAGKTIAESIENVFGRNSKVRPHTYDITKEAEIIAIGNNAGRGFHTITVTRENKIPARVNYKANRGFVGGLYPPGVIGRLSADNPKIPIITSGEFQGRKFVSLSYQDMGYSTDPNVGRGFTLYSQIGGDLTPAQQDLLKLKGNLTEEDTKLLQFPTYDSKSNFDAILSLIHTLANK